MTLSIIILNYHSAGLVRQSVRSIFAVKSSLDFEVIVVDNASDEKLGLWLKDNYPAVNFISLPSNRGYAAGNNVGLKQARGDYFLILNPDIIILPGKLEALIDFMESHPHCGLAGPRLVNPDGSLQYSAYQFPFFWLPLFRRTIFGNIPAFSSKLRKYQMMDWDHQDSRTVDWLLGACLLARRVAVEEVGLMDERFFLYVEDTDWCRRFWAKGWEVWYVAEVELVHFHERLSAQKPLVSALFSRIAWIHIFSWVKYFLKWRGVKNISHDNKSAPLVS